MAGANLAEAKAWCVALEESAFDTATVSVSHLTNDEFVALSAAKPNLKIRPRIGTALWLGRLDTFEVESTVLDVHPVAKGDRIGYRQQPVKKSGHIAIVAGGTSHGIGLEAPRAVASTKERGKVAAKGLLAASNRALSPFFISGQQAWFVEPPHMQASMIFVPAGAELPKVGDKIAAQLRSRSLPSTRSPWLRRFSPPDRPDRQPVGVWVGVGVGIVGVGVVTGGVVGTGVVGTGVFVSGLGFFVGRVVAVGVGIGRMVDPSFALMLARLANVPHSVPSSALFMNARKVWAG